MNQPRRGYKVAIFCECGAKLLLQNCIIEPAAAVQMFRNVHRGEGHEPVDAARYKELRRRRQGLASLERRRIFDD